MLAAGTFFPTVMSSSRLTGCAFMGYLANGADAAILALGIHAASAAPVCHGTTLPEPAPTDVAPAVIETFHATMTPAEVEHTGFVRCDHGVVLACLTGANLNCGKGNASRRNRGAESWCQTHPDASFVPLFAAGHDSIYAWRCHGTRAIIERQVQRLDAQGYVVENWREVR
jgi:hypothetical protein